MKTAFIITLLFLISCTDNKLTVDKVDNRPKDQIRFNQKVESIKTGLNGSLNVYHNAVLLDSISEEFNQYADDSLRNIKNWEVIVNDINDNKFTASGFVRSLFNLDTLPIYNIIMYSVIKNNNKIDHTLDSLNLPQADVVFLTFTFPKTETKFLDIVKKIKPHDTLLISGNIMYYDRNLRPNFKQVIYENDDWNLDFDANELGKNKII